MATIEVKVPNTLRISYRQEKDDPDYGTCLWADFDFDTEKYTLQIMSDCGNYSYGWVPTPNSESFFKLCRRIGPGYLLDKISYRSQIDDEATYAAAVSLFECEDLPDGWQEELKEDLYGCCSEIDVVDALKEFAESNDIQVDGYDVWCCVNKDFTANAKKIADIYAKYIIPAIPED